MRLPSASWIATSKQVFEDRFRSMLIRTPGNLFVYPLPPANGTQNYGVEVAPSI